MESERLENSEPVFSENASGKESFCSWNFLLLFGGECPQTLIDTDTGDRGRTYTSLKDNGF